MAVLTRYSVDPTIYDGSARPRSHPTVERRHQPKPAFDVPPRRTIESPRPRSRRHLADKPDPEALACNVLHHGLLLPHSAQPPDLPRAPVEKALLPPPLRLHNRQDAPRHLHALGKFPHNPERTTLSRRAVFALRQNTATHTTDHRSPNPSHAPSDQRCSLRPSRGSSRIEHSAHRMRRASARRSPDDE